MLQSEILTIENGLAQNQTQELLAKIHNYRGAIRWLELGQELNIDPKSKTSLLPWTETQSPSSEFRIIEDHESDDPNHWTEIKIKGKEFRPSPGDLIIQIKK